MKQLKKTLLTLVALLALTTGAWAQTETLLTTITATAKEQASYSTANMATVSFSYTGEGYSVYNDNWGWWGYGWIATVTAAEGYTITKCVFYDNDGASATDSTDPFIVETEEQNKKPKVNGATFGAFTSAGIKKIEVYGYVTPADAGPEVAWTAATKTGTFTMPGGNVTLEPEYYPQATVADGGVTAADADARATTDDPLVKVDATKLTGAKKLMYFVSNSGTTAPAYDAEGWTDQLPTAEGFTEAGIVYVWYYPVGTDEGQDDATATYSDGDIKSLSVNIAAAPTYAVTFAEGTNTDEWTAEPAAGVKKGETVTVTYNGSKKVIGVKAEKKAKAPAPITVTWNNDDITGSGKSFTKGGVTLTAGSIDFDDKSFEENGTFTTTLGNFTKIEVVATNGFCDVAGTGWSGNSDKRTWTGNASSVSFIGDIYGDGNGIKFVFTIEPTN